MYCGTESERIILQRYFLNQNADINQRFFITESDDIHHISNVMRHQIGDNIIITFNDQLVYQCEIVNIENNAIEIEPNMKVYINTELPQAITICSGLIKADKYEWLLQKATELGAHQFIATTMDRSVVKLSGSKIDKKLDRWQKIVKEAAEQSYRLLIPNVEYVSNLQVLCDNIDKYDYVLVAYEDAAKNGETNNFKTLLQQFKPNERILVIFGPEGGFSDKEVSLLDKVGNQIGLGPRILRAETAPLYVLSAISYQKELLG